MMVERLSMSSEELNKMIAVKKMDLEECEQELYNRYYPSVVRVAMMRYISELRHQLEMFNADDLKRLRMDKKKYPGHYFQ